MGHSMTTSLPVFLAIACVAGLAIAILLIARCFRPNRSGRATQTPYESGMDPIHDTHRRFDVRFYLVAIAFLVFDVELLFLYPWAVTTGQQAVSTAHFSASGKHELTVLPASGDNPVSGDRRTMNAATSDHQSTTIKPRREDAAAKQMFIGGMIFLGLLTLGFIYDWRKGVFQWR
jgi:NADH-quinone oxidoreductase subunit A